MNGTVARCSMDPGLLDVEGWSVRLAQRLAAVMIMNRMAARAENVAGSAGFPANQCVSRGGRGPGPRGGGPLRALAVLVAMLVGVGGGGAADAAGDEVTAPAVAEGAAAASGREREEPAGVLSAVVRASQGEPARDETKDATKDDSTDEGRGARGAGGPRPRDVRDLREMRQRGADPTEEELTELRAFLRQHSPNRFELFEQLPGRGQARMMFLRNFLNRYRNLQRMKAQDETVYNALLRQFELQDEVFGILRDVRDGDAEALVKLRAKVRELVDASLAERQRRVEALERSLAEEKRRLSEDMADPDAVVEHRLQQMRAEAADLKQRFEDLREWRAAMRQGRAFPSSMPPSGSGTGGGETATESSGGSGRSASTQPAEVPAATTAPAAPSGASR